MSQCQGPRTQIRLFLVFTSIWHENIAKILKCQARMAIRYGTAQFLLRSRCAGTIRFFVMVRVRHVGTERLFCKGTGTVRWYALLIKNPRLFAHYSGFL